MSLQFTLINNLPAEGMGMLLKIVTQVGEISSSNNEKYG
jgi:hypothetical protein